MTLPAKKESQDVGQ